MTANEPLSWMIQVLEESGYSREELLHDCDIRPGSRSLDSLSLPQQVRIYHLATVKLEMLLCELEQRASLGPKGFEMQLLCIIHCVNLRAVFSQIDDFFQMLGGGRARLTLTVEGDTAYFDLDTEHNTQHPASYLLVQSGLATYFSVFSWLIGQQLPITAINLACPPEYEYLTRGILNAPVYFDRNSYGFSFDSRWLDAPVLRTYNELAAALPHFPNDLILTQILTERFDRRISLLIISMLNRGQRAPTAADIARLFNMSESTFRRRCKEENVTFQGIKDQSLKEMACEWLKHSEYDVEEIAILLGFGEARSFRRAFKRWTGTLPSEYRRR